MKMRMTIARFLCTHCDVNAETIVGEGFKAPEDIPSTIYQPAQHPLKPLPLRNCFAVCNSHRVKPFCLTAFGCSVKTMQPKVPPSKVARLSDHATSRTSFGSYAEEASPSTGIGLSLKLGPGSGIKDGCSKSNGFTFLQLQELEHQALIYHYIEAGLAVPHHLILPIWQSVAGSLSNLSDGQNQLYSYWSSTLYSNYRDSMETEPGRCRRTDGKKWRCSKEVVPNQKYCERHMHRGRQRSRKRVEAPATCTTKTTVTSINTHISSTTLSSVSPPKIPYF
ncbi:hypothetical protein NMG60_11027223 [Bertholletia excelsa]